MWHARICTRKSSVRDEIVDSSERRGFSIHTILFQQARRWFCGGLSHSKSRLWCSHPYCALLIHSLSQHYCFKSCLDTAENKWQSSGLFTRSPCRGRCWQKGQEGGGLCGEGRQHGGAAAAWAWWDGTMLRDSKWHVQSHNILLKSGKAYRLQLHFVNFNRKTHTAFWSWSWVITRFSPLS